MGPEPTPDSTPTVARESISAATCAGVHGGFSFWNSSRISAAAPATCGEAIEVPLIVFDASSLVFQADVIEEPGAKMSTQDPVLEKLDLASEIVVEPTVRASGVLAGDLVHASPDSLPAETAYVTPAAMEF